MKGDGRDCGGRMCGITIQRMLWHKEEEKVAAAMPPELAVRKCIKAIEEIAPVHQEQSDAASLVDWSSLPPELVDRIAVALAQEDAASLACMGLTCALTRRLIHPNFVTAHASELKTGVCCTLEQLNVQQRLLAILVYGAPLLQAENRFSFDQTGMLLDEEADGPVSSSQLRLESVSSMMRMHPRLTLRVDAHCSSKHRNLLRVADFASEQHGRLLANKLMQQGIGARRIKVIAWGKRLTAVAEPSHVRGCFAERRGGWADLFLSLDGIEFPTRPPFYDDEFSQPPSLRLIAWHTAGVAPTGASRMRHFIPPVPLPQPGVHSHGWHGSDASDGPDEDEESDEET